MAYTDYELKSALPNKSYNEDGTTTDLLGNVVQNPVPEYENKQSLPNKWLNPDGSYSTLLELISGAIDTEIFVVVEELPETGEPNKIYLVPNEKGELDEFCWVNNEWDTIGMLEFDLSQYSTTDEMNAAILAALNTAKAYADALFGNVKQQVYYWSGNKTAEDVELWNKIYQASKVTDVIVISISNNAIFKIPKGANLKTSTISSIFKADITTGNTFDNVHYTYRTVSFSVNSDDIIVGIYTGGDTLSNINVLGTGKNYSTPYEPQYPGSPATKKYVDDSITTNITNVLGGSY